VEWKKGTPMSGKSPEGMNWPVVMTAIVAIAVLYFIISYAMAHGTFSERQTMYCYYERDMGRDPLLPRDECVILKIHSKDLDDVDWTKFFEQNMTSECTPEFNESWQCEGETHHFAKFFLDAFCTTQPCDVDGVICGAYYLTYLGNDSVWRQDYEEGMFIEHNLSEEDMLSLLKECDV
jgi:hypothetical protein